MPRRKLDFLSTREHFIPVHLCALVDEMLCDPRLSENERTLFRVFVRLVQARIHFEYMAPLKEIARLYDPFNPERDTLPLASPTGQEREEAFSELRNQITALLTKANYTHLSKEQLQACLESRSRWGLAVKVEPEKYRWIDVFYRGAREDIWPVSRPLGRLLGLKTPVWIFSRVVVLVRQDHPRWGDIVLVKMFRDIVLEDLKMTWPDVRVLMRPVDQLVIAVTALGGVLSPIAKLLLAAALSPFLVAGAMLGFFGAMARAIHRFFNCKKNYIKTLTHNLYYQNVANNLSALSRICDAAEEEEVKEILLAYFLLYAEKEQDYSAEELDKRIERWLADRFGLSAVDFEITDALQKLLDKQIVIIRPKASCTESVVPVNRPTNLLDNRLAYKAVGLQVAIERLDEWWDKYFQPEGLPREIDPESSQQQFSDDWQQST